MALNKRWTWLLALLPTMAGLLLFIADPRPLQTLRNNVFDQYQRWQPRPAVDVPVQVVDIDDESLTRLGQWPWPRTRLAELVSRLHEAGAAIIVFDFIFAEPDRTSPAAVAEQWRLSSELRERIQALPDHDKVFAESLARANAVIGFAVDRKIKPGSAPAAVDTVSNLGRFAISGAPPGPWLHTFERVVEALPELVVASKGYGALTVVPDSDGIVRRVPLVLQLAGRPVATVVGETLRVGVGAGAAILSSSGQESGLTEVRIGPLTIPVNANGELWVHYGKRTADRSLSAWKVLNGELPPERIKDRLVLVGTSAQGLLDLRFSALGQLISGVEVQSQALEQILAGQYLTRPSWGVALEALILVIGCLAVGLIALQARALVAAMFAAGAVLLVAGGCWHAFATWGLLIDAATPAGAILGAFGVCSLFHHFAVEREQRWIRTAFARYVSPNRVSFLIKHREALALGGRRQECSFVFTDLAGFTALMETTDPADAVSLLNGYLDEMIAIAFRHDGTLDRIVGDAVVIVFSAPVVQPDHSARALACALEMDAFALRYSKGMQARGIDFGLTRIGVHCGEVIVGNFGGANFFDYRALGDAVNSASRLEGANKYFGTRVCVSDDILRACPDVVSRPVARLVLKGKTMAISVFEPVVDEAPGLRAPLAAYQAAYRALAAGLPEAGARFAVLARDFPDDPLVNLHFRRLRAGEHGVLITMTEK